MHEEFTFGVGQWASGAHVQLDSITFATGRFNLVDEQHGGEAFGARQVANRGRDLCGITRIGVETNRLTNGFLAQVSHDVEFGMWNVIRAVGVTKSCGDHAHMLDGCTHGLLPTDGGFDFVADTEAVFEQHRQTREVIADTMLATNRQCRTKKAGARQKERSIEVEHVEHGDDGDDPQNETRELMEHAGGGFDALATTVLATLESFSANSTHRVLPPTLAATGFAIGNFSHDDTQDCIRHAGECKTTDDDDECNHRASEKSLDAPDFFICSKQCERWEECRKVHPFSVADDVRHRAASCSIRMQHGGDSYPHPFISLAMMKPLRLALLVGGVIVLAACGDVEVVSPTTSQSASSESTVDETDPTDAEQTPTTIEVVVTTTVESTTTTAVPVTTTTVLDILCIKTTACQYANLVGVDFSRLKLDFIDFSVANLGGASFVGANLTNSVFIRSDVSAVNFAGATLKNVDFTAATMTAASFKGANLEGAVLCDVDLTGVLDLTKDQLDQVKKFKTKGKVYCP